jgi:competence ComEA-like helix-hairpin-helix protein
MRPSVERFRGNHLTRRLGCIALAIIVLAGSVAARATIAGAAQVQAPDAFDPLTSTDPGAATFRTVCVMCHPPDRIVGTRRTAFEWEEIIEKMLTKGAKGTDQELQTVFLFLVQRYGKVNINTAPADEIATVLSVPSERGEAIVQYRSGHGKFTDVDSVRKVPGLEDVKLELDAFIF